MKNFLLILIAVIAAPTAVKSDIWIDVDRSAGVNINKNGIVNFFDTSSFYYFDQIFSNVRKNDIQLNVCLGFSGLKKEMPSDCLSKLPTYYSVHNRGKTKALNVNLSNYPFLLNSFEEKLRLGETLEISIDDGYLFYMISLNKNHTLNEESIKILQLSD